MDGTTPEQYYKNLPTFTRGILTTVFLVTALVQLSILNPTGIVLDWEWVVFRLHIWRPFTSCFFLGEFSFNWLISVYNLTHFGKKLEKNDKFQDPSDYCFFLLLQMLLISIISSALAWPTGLPFNGESLVFAVVYYASRCEPEARLSVHGFSGISIPGYQFPFFLMGLSLLMGGDIWEERHRRC